MYLLFILVFLIAAPILAIERYVIEGVVENVTYSISNSCPRDKNSLKFHATQHMASCKYASKMEELKQAVQMIAEHCDDASHTTILVMNAGTSETFYVDNKQLHHTIFFANFLVFFFVHAE